MSEMIVKAFPALRPRPEVAAQVASVPYDVVDRDEAYALVQDKPLSFLRVGRSEVTLDQSVDPYHDEVYAKAASNLQRLVEDGHLVQEADPALYLYRLTWRGSSQVGVVGAYSVEAYRSERIKKHERTRAAKEDDRTRHIMATKAQTGPVFLVHRPSAEVADLRSAVLNGGTTPLFSFTADDGVVHEIWKLSDVEPWERALEAAGDFYIADGHHRAASAERTATSVQAAGGHPASRFLAVAFPTDQVKILPYHRVVTELNGKSEEEVVEEARQRFQARPMSDVPKGEAPSEPSPGQVFMYLGGVWYEWTLPHQDSTPGVADRLDSAVLQREFLEPVLGIADVRSDPRIDFVGGIRGVGELMTRVDSGRAVAAFAMAATTLDDLLKVSDAGEIMPPKSTWFEPKLRDGLLIHKIS